MIENLKQMINKKRIKRFPMDCKRCKHFQKYNVSVYRMDPHNYATLHKVGNKPKVNCELAFYERFADSPDGILCPKYIK